MKRLKNLERMVERAKEMVKYSDRRVDDPKVMYSWNGEEFFVSGFYGYWVEIVVKKWDQELGRKKSILKIHHIKCFYQALMDCEILKI